MKVNCEIVQDLLPLYEDGVCSESSRAAVEEHLKACENCRGLKDGAAAIPEGEIVLEATEEEKKVAGSFKKVRRRWGMSLMAILLAIPLLWMTVNQIRGSGICFTNLDDIWVAKRFVAHLEQGEYEEAAQMYDFGTMYLDILSALERTQKEYKPQYEKVEIGGEIWYADPWTAADCDYFADPMDAWHRLLYNRYPGILFTEEALDMVMQAEPELLQKLSDCYYRTDTGSYLEKVGTPWGEFYTEANYTDGQSLCMMPEAMYLEYLPVMQQEAEEGYQWTQEAYGAVREMTEAEFTAYMQANYASELKEAFDGQITISGGSFSGAYRLGSDGWQVELKVRAASGQEANHLEILLFPEESKIRSVSCSYAWSVEYAWLETLIDALHSSYLN